MEMLSSETAVKRPALKLRRFVACYAGYRIETAAPGAHRGLPSRHVSVLISLAAPIDIAAKPNAAGEPATYQAFIGGLHDTPATVRYGPRLHGMKLLLMPLGVRQLLGVPASALACNVTNLADILGGRADELITRLHEAASWAERFDVLDDVLARGIGDRSPSPDLSFAWQRLVATKGRQPIAALAEDIGWSRRHLAERFRNELGVSPKVAARIIRFEHASSLIARQRLPLAMVAAECGYHDQAHMSREWNALAGSSPRAWIAKELPNIQDYELTGADDADLGN